ncbi:MAG: hypothetical protein KJ556_17405 [Gammaproteobacteria bacterium]|nr:hypothetical protein [Gammaproteobacteria bacterium]MBU2057383.1 hypothetical protein [Gammaproteobacteria bacterium]MBU2176889.1 hypothetical protein [Gammaproteobacteria bacterium]MBU2248001.1 hypothetical protein [Gammaproteobacteria bacterium]MBU2343175.1 hypothetical protein [Gammaproteobacteria bacterium]
MEPKKVNKKPTIKAIYRAVASSTAIETGESTAVVLARLKKKSTKFSGLKLAY